MSERQRVATRRAAIIRHHGVDDPRVAELDGELRTARIADAIRKAVEDAPPLTSAQRDRLRALLDGGVDPAAAA